MICVDKGRESSFSLIRLFARFVLCAVAVACIATSVYAQTRILVSREDEMPRALVTRDYTRRYVVGVEGFQVQKRITQATAHPKPLVSRDRNQFKTTVGRGSFDPLSVVSSENVVGRLPVTVEREQPQKAVSRDHYHRGLVTMERRTPALVVSQEPSR